jgi:hypothetical protein
MRFLSYSRLYPFDTNDSRLRPTIFSAPSTSSSSFEWTVTLFRTVAQVKKLAG